VSRFPAHTRRIVQAIKAARIEADISGRALSRMLKQDHTYINRIEKMRRKVSAEEIAEIARALGHEPADFYSKTLRR
jgi:transcriptional regulator with XRE-family HTH domain